MTQKDRSEVREMLHGILAGYQAMNESAIVVTNVKLENIDNSLSEGMGGVHKRLDVLNGKVAEHEKTINIHLPHSVARCAQNGTIQAIRDNMITAKAVRNAIIIGISGTSGLIGIAFAIFKMFIEK